MLTGNPVSAHPQPPLLSRMIAPSALEKEAQQNKHLDFLAFRNILPHACRALCYHQAQLNCLGGYHHPLVGRDSACALAILKEQIQGGETTKQCPLGLKTEAYFHFADTSYDLFQGPCYRERRRDLPALGDGEGEGVER